MTNATASIDITNIEFLKTIYGYLACKIIRKINGANNQLDVLAELIPNDYCFDSQGFIEFVLKKYSSKDPHIVALLRQQRISYVAEWAFKFKSNPQIFQHHVYLPFLSAFGNMKIQICQIISDEKYGWVFTASQPEIDYSAGNYEPHHLYVVIAPNENHISAIFTLMPTDLNHLHWALRDLPEKHPERINILLRIAIHYENEAIQHDKKCYLKGNLIEKITCSFKFCSIIGLIAWKKAQDYYKQALSRKDVMLNEQLNLAELGYCQCLLKQHRYSLVNERLNNPNHIESSQLWLIYAKAQRKIGNYESAKQAIQQAEKMDKSNMININVQRELKLIQMKDKRVKINKTLDLSTSFLARNKERSFYNILSVDGGGIRGIIPAIWLMALEHKIKRPVSSIFDVVAGTSTGAIISAGLTAPSLDNPTKPRYQASDLVQLYQKKADEVFTKNSNFVSQLRTLVLKEPKYLDKGRHLLFSHYFGGTKIVDTISELLIPVVRSGSNGTDLFTRHAARKDMTKNGLLTEILMCTSAAPTYFPPYNLKGTVYIDGGVQANNPSMHAYDHILEIYPNCDRNRIRLLSLGTGDCILDPLNPQDSRNLLFWARNNESVMKVLMDGPQNNIDLHLNRILGDNYYRWQIWFENPIELDDIRESSINRLIDLSYEYLEEMEGYDNRQRLGCLVEDLQSTF